VESSNRLRVAVVNVTSVITGVHLLFGHVGVAGSGPGGAVVRVNVNWPFVGVGIGPVDPVAVTVVS
jgi:hypothetical protein